MIIIVCKTVSSNTKIQEMGKKMFDIQLGSDYSNSNAVIC